MCLKSTKSLLCAAAFRPRKMKSGNVYRKIKRRVTPRELKPICVSVCMICFAVETVRRRVICEFVSYVTSFSSTYTTALKRREQKMVFVIVNSVVCIQVWS